MSTMNVANTIAGDHVETFVVDRWITALINVVANEIVGRILSVTLETSTSVAAIGVVTIGICAGTDCSGALVNVCARFVDGFVVISGITLAIVANVFLLDTSEINTSTKTFNFYALRIGKTGNIVTIGD